MSYEFEKNNITMCEKIIHIDELTDICGFYTEETNVNNSYGCKHPEQEEKDIDNETGKEHGKCYAFSCPLCVVADLEDMKKLNNDLYDEYKNDEFDPSEMGADYVVIDCKLLNDR